MFGRVKVSFPIFGFVAQAVVLVVFTLIHGFRSIPFFVGSKGTGLPYSLFFSTITGDHS